MVVGVDQARHEDAVGEVDPLGMRMLRREVGGGTDGGDRVAGDQHGRVGQDVERVVHGHDGVGNQQGGGHLRAFTREGAARLRRPREEGLYCS